MKRTHEQCERGIDFPYSIQCEAQCYSNSPFPYFALPCEVGHFSVDKSRNVLLDKSQLKFYIEPETDSKLYFDLREGFHTFIDKNKLPENTRKELLDPLLRFLILKSGSKSLNKEQFKTNLCFGADFVSWRGALTKIANSPYENRDPWKFSLIRIHGVVFVCELETEEKRRQEENMDERGRIMSYGGFKFEQFVTASNLNDIPDTSKPVDTREQFCSVVRGKLGNNRIVFGGETDCIDTEGKYVELKTTAQHFNERMAHNFNKFKSVKWWLQSFLIGIETIVCGYRNNTCIVERVQSLSVKSLCKNAIGWKPSICLNFLNEVLNLVKNKIVIDDATLVYILELNPHTRIVNLRPECASDEIEAHFLPSWFMDVL